MRHIERNAALLFLVPADSDDIAESYRVLLSELERYNPAMLRKRRVLAVSKCDLIDEELEQMLAETLPRDIPTVFISAVTGQGIDRLKDILWENLNADDAPVAAEADETFVHRDREAALLASDFADWDDDELPAPSDDDDDTDEEEELEEYDWEDLVKS